MAKCEHCKSNNYRLQELGAITNDYFCMDCKKSFERLAPSTKWKVWGIFSTIFVAIISVLMGGGNSGGGRS